MDYLTDGKLNEAGRLEAIAFLCDVAHQFNNAPMRNEVYLLRSSGCATFNHLASRRGIFIKPVPLDEEDLCL